MKNTIRVWLIFLPALCAGSVFAAITGKIAGRVVDAETGEPLVGVNVFISSTTMGAATDANGDFFILNIPPGKYDIQTQMIGYRVVKMENVQVRTNATTTLNFKMSTTVIEGETITVTVDAIATKKDQTSSVRNISADQIEALPVESINQVIDMQPGVIDGHFRGGRSNEVSYMLDGLQVTDVYDRSRLVEVEKEVIQDVEVILGTFNAEYGRAMSGVVNAVTKDGGNTLEGSFSTQLGNYYTSHDDIFIGLKPGDVARKKNYRLQLSGPIFRDKLTFLVNLRQRDEKNHLNGIYRFNPYDYSDFSSPDPNDWYSEHTGDNGIVPMSTFKGLTVFSKLTWKPLGGLKVSLVYNKNTGESSWYNHYMKYNPEGMPSHHSDVSSYSVLFNHTLSERIFHEFKVSYLENWEGSYVYEDAHDSRYVSEWYGLSTGPGFATGAQDKGYNKTTTKKLDFMYDITWQVTKHHSLKTGFLYTKNDKNVDNHTIVNLYRNDAIDRMQDTLWTPQGDIEKIRYPFYEPVLLDDSTAYANVFRKKPVEFSAYFQDKMEFDDLVINLGLRYDYFDPVTVYPSNWRNPANQLNFSDNPERMSDYPDADVKQQLSPRFGLSYTLGKQAKVHFSYGHFFQIPDAYSMYTNHNFRVVSAQFSTLMGNPLLKPEKQVKYEVGMWQELIPGVSLDVALYYADVYNLLSTVIMTTYNQTKYGLYSNKDYGNRKGLEVGLNAEFGNVFTSLNYTLQYTRGNADNPTQTFTRAGNSMDPIARLITMPWDQRHTLNLTCSYQTRRWGAAVTGFYNSGQPYTWSPIPESRLAFVNLYPNNSWKPSNYSVDLNAFYKIKLTRGINLRLAVLIYNLLDRMNEFGVDSTTGRANQEIIREIDLVRHRSDFNEYRDTVNNPANLSAPREIKFEVGFTF